VPLVRIEVLGERTASERQALFDAVHGALVEAFRIPDDDRTQRLIEHDAGRFEIPPGRSERYTLIEITAFPGRSVNAKRDLYRAIVRNLAPLGVPEEDVMTVLVEPPLEDWGLRGGRSADQVDLGYRLDV
jgi:phenylpyruvate tautomerase PptA (4-oxalocrotonate tautomerase family)